MTRRDDTGTENDAGTRVGWIGLGAMGFPMAGCVARAGFDVSAYDINPARAEALTTDGVKPAASINEAASGADVLIVMVATPDQVESVLFGDDPAAEALTAGAAVVVMATVGPAPVEAVGRAARVAADRPGRRAGLRRRGPCRRRGPAHHGRRHAVGRGPRATAARRDGPQCTPRRDCPRRRAEGQARQSAAVRRPHRCGRRSPRSRRGDAARPRRHLGGPPRRCRRLVHARRPRSTHGARHRRGQERARHLRQGHGPRHRRRPRQQLPRAAGLGGGTALPRRPAARGSAAATTRPSSRCSAAPSDHAVATRRRGGAYASTQTTTSGRK